MEVGRSPADVIEVSLSAQGAHDRLPGTSVPGKHPENLTRPEGGRTGPMPQDENNFMSDPRQYSPASARARVAAGSTAFAAALLLYFGFTTLEPTGNDLGAWSLWIFYHTLRIGGAACAVLAVLLWLGVSAMLIVDGVVATAIGLLFLLTGAGMLLGGGYLPQAVINLLCGAMFASQGLRILREPSRHPSGSFTNPSPSKGEGWVRMRDPQGVGGPHDIEPPQRAPLPEIESASFPNPSPSKGEGRLRVRPPPSVSVSDIENGAERSTATPTEGYLAALAKKPKPTGDTPP